MSSKKVNNPWNKGLNKYNDIRIHRIALSKIGKKRSLETRLKISQSLSGEKHPFYGKKFSKETREKIRNAITHKNPEGFESIFTEDRKQILLGSLMGDASLRPTKVNCYLEETHCMKQRKYLLWKSEYLDFLKTRTTIKLNNNDYKAIKMQTGSYPFLRDLYNQIYLGKKKSVTPIILNQLGDLGLTVWYLDDGHATTAEDLVRISTDCFSYEEHVLMRNKFNEKWGVLPRIGKRKGKFYLLFNKNDSMFLLSLFKRNIEKYSIPSVMFYKLGSLWDGNSKKIRIARSKKNKYKKRWRKLRSNIRKREKRRDLSIKCKNIRLLYWQKGLNSAEIGKIMGYSGAGIRKIMRKNGIPTRTPSETHSGERNGFYGRHHSTESIQKMVKNRWEIGCERK